MKKSKIRPTKLNPLGDKPVKDLSEMEEVLHQFTIMREHMDARIDTVIEGQQVINRRIDGLEYAMNANIKELRENFDIKVKLLADKMDKVALRVDDHEERITHLEAANS